ncbi:hypothetical protein U8V72_15095 [Priestia filamentosa]|uniref:hypothetical protein n=1 Tax=Priestia filamentosa TaxID=1402861 RepID=UPI00397CCBD2
MLTIVIGKEFVGKKSYVAQQLKLRYSENIIFAVDNTGKLTHILEQQGLQVTQDIHKANIIVSDNINELTEKDFVGKEQVFFILSGNNINKEIIEKAEQVILFPVNDCEGVSEVLDIPVNYLQGLKYYEPIMVI